MAAWAGVIVALAAARFSLRQARGAGKHEAAPKKAAVSAADSARAAATSLRGIEGHVGALALTSEASHKADMAERQRARHERALREGGSVFATVRPSSGKEAHAVHFYIRSDAPAHDVKL